MEGNMVNKKHDVLASKDGLSLIQSLFKSISNCKLISIVDHDTYYYEVKYLIYKKNTIGVSFICERAYIEAKIFVNDQELKMKEWKEYNESLRLLTATSDNIYILFSVVKQTINSLTDSDQL
jgi:hypothetical protein